MVVHSAESHHASDASRAGCRVVGRRRESTTRRRRGGSPMRKPEIVAAVQETARISTREEAEAALRATLRVFGERLPGDETRDLAAHVPPHLALELPEEGHGDRFDLHEFYVRVARYEG